MTIPATMNNIEKRKILTGIQQSYSILTNAVSISEVYNGPATSWKYFTELGRGNRSDSFATTYLTPYLNVSYTCQRNRPNADQKCFAGPNNEWYSSAGTPVCLQCSYGGPQTDAYMFRLKNGMSMSVNVITEGGCTSWAKITVDIDGPYKGGSVMGRDVFSYSIGLLNSSKVKQGLIPGINMWNCNGTAWEYGSEGWHPTNTTTSGDNQGAQNCGVTYGCNAVVGIIKNGFKFPSNYPLNKISTKGRT